MRVTAFMSHISAITGEPVKRSSLDPNDKYSVPFYKRKLKDDPSSDSESNALSETGDDTKDRKRLEPR